MAQTSPTALERAIRSQPDELQRILDQPIPHVAIERIKQAHRLFLVGTGTSQHAAELGAWMLHEAGRAAVAVPSMHFVNWAPPVDPRDCVILISHNAGVETSYARAAYTMGMDAGLRVVPITRRGGDLLEAIETVDKEGSQTYSVSYTAVLLVLARLASELGAAAFSPEVLGRVPEAVAAAIASPGTEAVRPSERVLIAFGEGPASVTAREGALKLREASRVLAEGYDVEYLLHGSAVPLTTQDAMIALTPPDTNGLTETVARAAEAEGINVTRVVEPADLPPVLAQIPLVARMQLLAARLAAERHRNPDVVIQGAWANDALWSIGSG